MLRARQQKTHLTKKANVRRAWFVFDAKGKTLGRFAAEVAKVLRGKHKPNFETNIDTGDGVIVINADQIEVTGAKKAQKIYKYHTGYMSGLREVPYTVMMERNPEYIIERAVKGMMPKTRLGEAQYKHLRVYRGSEYKEAAQQPVAVNV
jgi:large subunit ribosomal protein L13